MRFQAVTQDGDEINLKSSIATETLEKFRRSPWEFQQTFETPLKNLDSFVKAILSAVEAVQSGSFSIDQVVFEPTDLISLLESHSIRPEYRHGLCLIAEAQSEVEQLLRTVLSEWIDFLFVPQPESFAIFADHDEYSTFYAHNRANLDRLASALSEQGFKAVTDYERHF